MPKSFSPTIKKALICLRLAWLCNDLETECPNHNYDFIAQKFSEKFKTFNPAKIGYNPVITRLFGSGGRVGNSYGVGIKTNPQQTTKKPFRNGSCVFPVLLILCNLAPC